MYLLCMAQFRTHLLSVMSRTSEGCHRVCLAGDTPLSFEFAHREVVDEIASVEIIFFKNHNASVLRNVYRANMRFVVCSGERGIVLKDLDVFVNGDVAFESQFFGVAENICSMMEGMLEFRSISEANAVNI